MHISCMHYSPKRISHNLPTHDFRCFKQPVRQSTRASRLPCLLYTATHCLPSLPSTPTRHAAPCPYTLLRAAVHGYPQAGNSNKGFVVSRTVNAATLALDDERHAHAAGWVRRLGSHWWR